MKILITGASGFLGKNLASEMQRETGYELLLSTTNGKSLFHFADDRTTIIETNQLENFVSDADIIIHCAFPRNSNLNDLISGIQFSKRVFDMVEKAPSKYLINISSQSVYDSHRIAPANEQSPIKPDSLYGGAKFFSEVLCSDTFRKTKYTNLRLSSLVGPGFDQRLINKFAKKVLDGETISVIRGGNFSFLDVRDAAKAIVCLIRYLECMPEQDNIDAVYNVGIDKSFTILEIAQKTVEIGNQFYDGTFSNIHIDDSAKSTYNSSVDSQKFMKAFNWKPLYTLEESIANVYRALEVE